MAEAILSPLLNVILETMASSLIDEVRSIWNLDEDLDNLSSTLSSIKAVLEDAEERQLTDKAVKDWLGKLKDVAYDADDVLDELAYEVLRSKVDGTTEAHKKRKVLSFLSYFTSNQQQFPHHIAQRIKEINSRLDKISKERDYFHLRERDGRSLLEERVRPQTSSLVDESNTFGRTEDKIRIIDLLMSNDNSNGKNASLISIVGMGGLGKTTLAQLVYNDENIKNHFDLRAWVCVSEDFDLKRLNRDIIESATRKGCSLSGLDPIQRSLEDILRGKRFLIVLDDVWNENHNIWDCLRVPFNVGAQGSKIIATTRSYTVSSTMDAIHAYRLEILPDDHCMALFTTHAFANGGSNAYPNLLEIGKELVRKCKGLPLALKAIGGLVSYRRDESYWRTILESEIWNLPVKHDDILPTLKLSYHHLPTHLKQCFAYCSIFPKDYVFEKDELIRFWIAEGFIWPIEGRRLEEIGSDYFDDLLSRSFFNSDKIVWAHSILGHMMHDLIHDLAQSVSNGECFRIEHGKKSHIPEKARHSSFVLMPDMREINVEAFEKSMNLRTFMLVRGSSYSTSFIKEVPCDLIARLSFLRVLDLSKSSIRELPDSICNLKHLRYLDLSSTSICSLPESLSSCYNLQILRLKYCRQLLQLPKETRKLVNLRHLDLEGCDNLKCTPQGIGKLTCLQTLSKFTVGRESGYGIVELKSLTELRGAISIQQLDNVENVEAAIDVNMKNRTHIQKLVLGWSNQEHEAASHQAMEILEVLQPNTNLKELSLENYGGTSFPSWILNTLLSNLVTIALDGCTRCKFLPPLGQLRFLNYLRITKMGQVKRIGREFCGTGEIKGFPSLRTLVIIGMDNLVEWCEVEEGDLPHLKVLYIHNCPKLMELPIRPSTLLDTLDLATCQQLTTIPLLPSLRFLKLEKCNEMLLRSMFHLTTLSTLSIDSFPELVSLPEGLFQHLNRLEDLRITNCESLISLPELDTLTTIPLLPSLRRLQLRKCNEMLLRSVIHLTTLSFLFIMSFPDLVSLPEGLFQRLNRLERLSIRNCRSLISLPELDLLQGTGVPAPMRILEVIGCINLKSMPKGLRNLTSLEKLWILSCPHITSLPEEERPPTLQDLQIRP